jgi:hypothetical protein
MFPFDETFRLSSFLVDEDEVVLVPSMAAIMMCLQDGEYIQVLPSEALWLFDALGVTPSCRNSQLHC